MNAASAKLKAWGQSVQATGQKVAGIGLAAAVPMALSAKRFADFDDAMRAVGATAGASQADLGKLTEKAKQLGRDTSFTATQVAQLMLTLARGGFSTAQIDAMTASVLDLARATGTDAQLAAGIMDSTIHQFGLKAEEAARVADGFTVAANKSFNTVTDLGEAMKYAGPAAADLGMSIEDTLAVLGQLGNMGIQASMAGTVLRRLGIIISSEGPKLKKLFGVESKDAAGNMRPMVDVLDEINTATKGMGTAVKAEKLNDVFGFLAITAASALGKTAISTRDLREQLGKAGGEANRIARAMDAGLGGTIRILTSSIDVAAIAIGEALAPALQLLGKWMIDTANDVAQWADENRLLVAVAGTAVTIVIGLGAAMIALGLALKVAAIGLSGFTALLGVFKVVVLAAKVLLAGFYLLLSPMGLVVAAAVGVGTAFLTASKEGEAARGTMAKSWQDIKDSAVTAWDGIVAAVKSGDLALGGKIAMLGLKMVWMNVVAALQDTWLSFTGWFIGVWDKIGAGFALIFNEAWAGLSSAWVSTIAFMAGVWHSLIAVIKRAWAGVVTELRVALMIATDIATLGIADTQTEAEIRAEGQKKLDAIDAERDRKKKAVAEDLAEKKVNIEVGRKGLQKEIIEGVEGAEKKRRAERDAKLAAAADEIAAERKKLDDLVAEAKGKAAEKAKAVEAAGAAGKAAGGPLAGGKASEATGTFFAAALGSLGSGSAIIRVATAVEQALFVQKQMLDALRAGGLILG